MNKERRERLSTILSDLQKSNEELTKIIDEEELYADNILSSMDNKRDEVINILWELNDCQDSMVCTIDSLSRMPEVEKMKKVMDENENRKLVIDSFCACMIRKGEIDIDDVKSISKFLELLMDRGSICLMSAYDMEGKIHTFSYRKEY